MVSVTGLSRAQDRDRDVDPPKYDKRDLTYANTFENGFQSFFIRAVEWLTGKVSIIRMVRAFERKGGAEAVQEFANDRLADLVVALGVEVNLVDRAAGCDDMQLHGQGVRWEGGIVPEPFRRVEVGALAARRRALRYRQ